MMKQTNLVQEFQNMKKKKVKKRFQSFMQQKLMNKQITKKKVINILNMMIEKDNKYQKIKEIKMVKVFKLTDEEKQEINNIKSTRRKNKFKNKSYD